MQKKIIALAVAGLASTAAFAQSNVTIYGRMDVGAVSRSGSEGSLPARGTRSEIASGLGAGSRIGFRGTEDLGNGLKAVFEAEFGMNIDNGPLSANATWQNRHSYVGLTGDFGTVVAGRLDAGRYNVALKYDANGGYGVANTAGAGLNQGYITRADNAIAYISPTFGGGFNFVGAYVLNLIGAEGSFNAAGGCTATSNFNCGDLRDVLLQGNYNNGPIGATLNYERVSPKDLSNADTKTWQAGASYDFGVVKVMGMYDKIDNDAKTLDSKFFTVGVQVPFADKFKAKLGYAKRDDRTSADIDCSKWGAGLTYDMSKRTQLYTDYGRVNNSSNARAAGAATCGITTSAAQTSLDAGGTAYGIHGFDFGIAHTF